MKLNLIVGTISAVIIAAIWYFSIKNEGWDAWGFHVFYGLMMLLSIILILRYLVWRITYNETEFTVRNILGISHTYRYSQITAMEQGAKESKLYVGSKKIELEGFSLEAMQFFFFAQQQYEKLTGNQEGIPEDWPRNDIFRGNIEGGMPVFIGEVIVLCVSLGIDAFLLVKWDQLNPEQYFETIILMLFLTLPILLWITCSVIIGRHPERYSRRIVKLFFREQFVRIYREGARQNAFDPLSWEELKDEMYNKNMDSFRGDIVLMDYNDDDSRRFAITKTENGYSYAFQRLFRLEADEITGPDDRRQGVWKNLPDYAAKQTFSSEDEAFAALKTEREYLEYYS